MVKELNGLCAELILPYFNQSKLTGFMILGKKKKNSYSMDDINVLTALANQAALAMENASLYENLENKVAERTMELKKARDALWGEMKLAK